MDNSRANLLEEAVGINKGGRVVAVEDCVGTSGAFVLYHFLKRSLHPDSSDVVIFIAFSHPFSHYERILRKMVSSPSLHGLVVYIYFTSMFHFQQQLSLLLKWKSNQSLNFLWLGLSSIFFDI